MFSLVCLADHLRHCGDLVIVANGDYLLSIVVFKVNFWYNLGRKVRDNMGFRFRKSIKLAPGVKINLNKKSASVTLGGKGLKHTVSTTRRRTTTAGIPGSGISYSQQSGGKNSAKIAKIQQSLAGTPYPKNNVWVHIALFPFTVGIGNIIYAAHINKKQKMWIAVNANRYVG